MEILKRLSKKQQRVVEKWKEIYELEFGCLGNNEIIILDKYNRVLKQVYNENDIIDFISIYISIGMDRALNRDMNEFEEVQNDYFVLKGKFRDEAKFSNILHTLMNNTNKYWHDYDEIVWDKNDFINMIAKNNKIKLDYIYDQIKNISAISINNELLMFLDKHNIKYCDNMKEYAYRVIKNDTNEVDVTLSVVNDKNEVIEYTTTAWVGNLDYVTSNWINFNELKLVDYAK